MKKAVDNIPGNATVAVFGGRVKTVQVIESNGILSKFDRSVMRSREARTSLGGFSRLSGLFLPHRIGCVTAGNVPADHDPDNRCSLSAGNHLTRLRNGFLKGLCCATVKMGVAPHSENNDGVADRSARNQASSYLYAIEGTDGGSMAKAWLHKGRHTRPDRESSAFSKGQRKERAEKSESESICMSTLISTVSPPVSR